MACWCVTRFPLRNFPKADISYPGWLIGPPELTLATLQASTRIIFCTNSPLQEAVAAGLEKANEHDFFPDQIRAYTERRDRTSVV